MDDAPTLMMTLLNSRAADDGIASYDLVRDALIEGRNSALGPEFDPHTAVFLSHVIWWLSILKEQIDE